MLKTYLYVPEDLDEQFVLMSELQKKSKAELIREAMRDKVAKQQQEDNAGLEAFRKLGEIGRKYKVKGPKDLSTNLDKYLWEEYEG